MERKSNHKWILYFCVQSRHNYYPKFTFNCKSGSSKKELLSWYERARDRNWTFLKIRKMY